MEELGSLRQQLKLQLSENMQALREVRARLSAHTGGDAVIKAPPKAPPKGAPKG